MNKKMIKNEQELARGLKCEELCVLSKKKDHLGSPNDNIVHSALINKSKEKICPIC
ncbi:MAG: hypothetical protein WCW44_01085 [archaeon]|jgi:hypothetical protein